LPLDTPYISFLFLIISIFFLDN
jgi:hypothetical protein